MSEAALLRTLQDERDDLLQQLARAHMEVRARARPPSVAELESLRAERDEARAALTRASAPRPEGATFLAKGSGLMEERGKWFLASSTVLGGLSLAAMIIGPLAGLSELEVKSIVGGLMTLVVVAGRGNAERRLTLTPEALRRAVEGIIAWQASRKQGVV